MKEPTISVCLPTYNGDKFVADAIDSVLNQTFRDFELLVGDDGSKDSTREVLQKYAGRDSRIKLTLHKQNLGYMRNSNFLLGQCQGKYTKTFAQDDMLEPSCLQQMLDVFEQHENIRLVTVSRRNIDEDGCEIEVQHKFPETGLHRGVEIIKRYLTEFLNRTGNPSQILFRTADAAGGLNAAYNHSSDSELALRLLENGDFYYIAEPLIRYRIHKDTTTISTMEDMSFAPDHVRLVDRFGSHMINEGTNAVDLWNFAIDGLINKMANAMLIRGISYDDFPTPGHWSNLKDGDNEEYQLSRRLACQLIKYATEKNSWFEDREGLARDEAGHLNAISAHNEQLNQRIQDLENELQSSTAEFGRLKQRTAVLDSKLTKLKTSDSWRVTAPLRKWSRTLSDKKAGHEGT
jgi:glycosyltransferase involved in cell wall biosynthesis